ncbi:hypothetical protein [Mangrovibacterium sp.]|uniref:hypothetical protein n=1 Tax=Mangrovibacterium sp. TaxID=1961364 RepID=UPI00356190A4
MQADVDRWLHNYSFWKSTEGGYSREKVAVKTYREVHIPEIGRRSDLIVYFSKRKIFNIELKLFNSGEVVRHATDHQSWANYSYVCMPHNVFIPETDKNLMIKRGIGLLLWVPEIGLVEAIYGRHKSIGQLNKQIRENVLKSLRREDRKKSQQLIQF